MKTNTKSSMRLCLLAVTTTLLSFTICLDLLSAQTAQELPREIVTPALSKQDKQAVLDSFVAANPDWSLDPFYVMRSVSSYHPSIIELINKSVPFKRLEDGRGDYALATVRAFIEKNYEILDVRREDLDKLEYEYTGRPFENVDVRATIPYDTIYPNVVNGSSYSYEFNFIVVKDGIGRMFARGGPNRFLNQISLEPTQAAEACANSLVGRRFLIVPHLGKRRLSNPVSKSDIEEQGLRVWSYFNETTDDMHTTLLWRYLIRIDGSEFRIESDAHNCAIRSKLQLH